MIRWLLRTLLAHLLSPRKGDGLILIRVRDDGSKYTVQMEVGFNKPLEESMLYASAVATIINTAKQEFPDLDIVNILTEGEKA